MSNTRAFTSLIVTLGLVACGGSGSSPTGGSSGTASGGEHHGHPHRPHIAAVDALHDELAPVFHAEPAGSTACAHASALHERATAVESAGGPADVAAADWTAATTDLLHASEALGTECTASGPAVAERLTALHDAWERVERLVESEPGEGDHRGDHHDGDHHDGDHHDGEHHDGDHHDGEHHDGDHHETAPGADAGAPHH